MTRITKIILPLLFLSHMLGAADLLLPKIELSPLPGGVRVVLDFAHVDGDQWQAMLEHPDNFAKYGYGIAGAPGDPALPMTTQLIPIESMGDINIQDLQRVDEALQDISLKSVPVGHLDSDLTNVAPIPYAWSRSSNHQVVTILPGEILSMRSEKYLPLTIQPLNLVPTTQTIFAPQTIEFEIHGLELAEHTSNSGTPGIRSLADPDEHFPRKGHYLIVSPPVYGPYMQFFTAWKERAGYKVTLVTTDVTGTSRNSIKNYIQTAWDTWEQKPDYLLLIGDDDQGMPGFFIQNDYGDNLIGDHPYALLEGDDSFPELMVGRLSIDTVSELLTFTSKIVRYESMPPMDQPAWFQRALMISTTLGAASAQATKEWVADKLLEYGYNHVYSAYAPEVISQSAISNPINQGVGFVNYRGFGYYSGWAGPDFTSNDILSSINNGGKTPIITSVVCGGGNFAAPDDPCFGEVWTRIGSSSIPRGAVAFFGPSELYTHTQFNNVIDIGIYSAITDGGVHTLGEALWAGKYELWRNYHQNTYYPFNQTAEFYHHVYNLLGDPGMQLWTDVPQLLDVVHFDTLSSAQNTIEVSVFSEEGLALSGAYVSLFNEDNAIGNYTDVSGVVNLPIIRGETDELLLTVTGDNLYPYQATITLDNTNPGLTLGSWVSDADTLLIAGQSAPMYLSLHNQGPALSDLTFSFRSGSPDVTVPAPFVVENLPANGALDPIRILLHANAELPHGFSTSLELEVTGNTDVWTWQKPIVVQAPLVDINDFLIISGNVMPGDSAQFEIELINRGGAPTGPITVTPLEHDLLTFSGGELTCPEVGMDGTNQTDNAIQVVFDEQIFPGEILDVQFECVTETLTDTLTVSVTIGDLIRFGPSQADAYGYRMFDEFDLSFSKAQSYDWLEIDPNLGGAGTMINIFDDFEEDDASTVITLPFPVTYYGEEFTQITVCTNGWAAFGVHSVVNFHNRIIPSPIGPPAMLSPFWDDLTTGLGRVYRHATEDDGQFIIEWSNVNHLYMQDRLSFELIIFNTDIYPTGTGDNDIKFQYNLYENTDIVGNFATIGIESPDSRTGLQASYNNINDPSVAYLRNNTAITFSTDRGTRYQDASVSVNSTDIHFQQNPWTTATDSIVITNTGTTPVAYAFTQRTENNRNIQTINQPVIDPNITKETPDGPPEASGLRDGVDAFGHYWQSDAEGGGLNYTWYDIETSANLLAWEGDPDDSSIGPVSLGFEFPFYTEIYDEMFIGSNGTISFESTFSPWLNSALPNTMSPPAMIAPWWDDLNNDRSPFGSIYFWTNENDQCIITWKDFPKWGTSQYYTFQVILHKIGVIIFQYQSMDLPTTSGTIGMQNADRDMGLTIYNNEITPPLSGTAISILRPVEWFSASHWSGRVDPGESESFIVDVSTIGLPQGHYEMPLTIETSAPNYPLSNVLVTLDIAAGELPWGDVNADYQININDAISLVDFVVLVDEMTEEQFTRFDLSGDNEVDVLDVIILIEAILVNP